MLPGPSAAGWSSRCRDEEGKKKEGKHSTRDRLGDSKLGFFSSASHGDVAKLWKLETIRFADRSDGFRGARAREKR